VELTRKELACAQPFSDPAQKDTVALAGVDVDEGALPLSVICCEPQPAAPSTARPPQRAERAARKFANTFHSWCCSSKWDGEGREAASRRPSDHLVNGRL